MSLDIATLGLRVDGSSIAQASRSLDGLTTAGGKAESAMSRLTQVAAGLGVTLSAGATLKKFFDETVAAQNAMAQLEARVKSTGGAAGLTVTQLDALSTALQDSTTFSDEAVKSAETMLLTFDKIKGDTMTGATKAVADLATALGTDLQSAAIQVGKALQDPEQGLLALRRSGVSFEESQQELIKGLFATGHEAEAQGMILRELQKEFGGAAEAARGTLGGALKGLANSLGDLFEITKDGTSGLVGYINGLNNATRAMKDHADAVQVVLAGLGAAGLLGVLIKFGPAMAAAFDVQLITAWAGKLSVAAAPLALAAAAAAAWTVVYQEVRELMDMTATEEKEHAKDATRAAEARAAQDALRAQREAAKAQAAKDAAKVAQMAHDKQVKADADEIAGLEAKTRRTRLLADAQEEVNKKLDREIRLRGMKDGSVLPVAGPGFQPMPKSGSQLSYDLTKGTSWIDQEVTKFSDAQLAMAAADKALQEKRAQQARESAKVREQIEQNFLRGLQESFAKTFADIFTQGIKSFNDLFGGIKRLIIDAASQLAASGLMDFLKGKYNAGAATTGADGKAQAGGVMNGLGAVAAAIPVWGWAAAAAVTIGGSLLAGAQAAREHAKALAAAGKQMLEDARKWLTPNTTADDLRAGYYAARDKATEGYANLGYKGQTANGGQAEKDFNALVLAMEAAYQIRLKNLEAEKKFLESMAAADLNVRMLRTAGLTDEADTMALWNQQVKEFADAVKAGFSQEFLAQLAQTQTYERMALAANQARAAQEKLAAAEAEHAASAAAAAERLEATRQRLVDWAGSFGDATENLAIRMLKATGKMGEAERRAFELQQKQEVRAAEAQIFALNKERASIAPMSFGNIGNEGGSWNYKDYWGGPNGPEANAARAYAAAIQKMIEDQYAYIKELKNVQAAEAVAFAASAGGATLGAVGPTTHGGTFNTVMSQATAEQSDRMVDQLVSMRVLAQEFWPYLRVIANKLTNGVDSLLGGSYQQSAALAGSSLVG